jgi:tRNA threonylcarbamoyladenosine biosynthesis protein TsaB
MLALALDSTTRAGSVALVEDDRVVEEREGDPGRTHAERLPRDLEAVLEAHGRRTSDIDLFAVAAGPGSFTGLRVGIAAMQGLAFVHRRPLTAVSALDALALTLRSDVADAVLIGVWMDAHRRDVFSALYRASDGEGPVPGDLMEVEGPHVGDPAATLARWTGATNGLRIDFIGDGASAWSDLLRARYPGAAMLGHPPLAGRIGRMAVELARRGHAADPADVRPLYVRRPDAIIDRERRTLSSRSPR